MTLDEIREELLGQHNGVRVVVAAARRAAEGADGVMGLEPLRDALGLLHAVLRRHNAREEELLRGIIRRVDAWGDVREMLMDVHHAGEHHGIVEALAYAARTSDGGAAARAVLPVLDRLLVHMAEEEEKILHPKVLTDEIVVCESDTFSG